MDATCAIQASIHVFSLVRKYVSRILGTYQDPGGFFCKHNRTCGMNEDCHMRFLCFARGRKMVILPRKQKNCTIRMPIKMPMLSMPTSLTEGPRPATKDW